METNEKLNEVAETLGEINYIPTVTEEKYKDDYINALDKAYDYSAEIMNEIYGRLTAVEQKAVLWRDLED